MASAVARGTAYERTVLRRLTALGAQLAQCGGAFDQGADLAGSWRVPWAAALGQPWPGDAVALTALGGAPVELPCVVQCKATSKPLGVAAMRELQHACASRFPRGTLAVAACSGGFALSALAKERSWALVDTLLLTITAEGALLAAVSVPASTREASPAAGVRAPAFVVRPLR